jgi:ankyrin repeat protein
MLKNEAADRISSSNIVKQLTSEKNKVKITLQARSCINHRIFLFLIST